MNRLVRCKAEAKTKKKKQRGRWGVNKLCLFGPFAFTQPVVSSHVASDVLCARDTSKHKTELGVHETGRKSASWEKRANAICETDIQTALSTKTHAYPMSVDGARKDASNVCDR